MKVLMVRSKIKEENVADARAATETVFQALEHAQPPVVRYAVSMLSDGVTLVALLELGKDGEHPVNALALPACEEFRENLKQWYAEPPAVEQMTVIGSYRLFQTRRGGSRPHHPRHRARQVPHLNGSHSAISCP